jgi:protein SCO1/2
MLRVLIVGLVVLVAAMFLMPRPSNSPLANATQLEPPLALPAVELVDTNGVPATLDVFRGDFSLLFFGFTHCPDVCPLTLKLLAETRASLVERFPKAVPKVVFVSVDPERDSPEQIAAYLRNFDPSFVGVTAADERHAPLLKALGVGVEKHRHGGESYNVVHNSVVYMIGPGAELIAVSSSPNQPATLAADYIKVRQRYRAQGKPSA